MKYDVAKSMVMIKRVFLVALLTLILITPTFVSKAEDAIVKDLITDEGDLITGFDTTSGWTVGSSGASQVRDTAHYVRARELNL